MIKRIELRGFRTCKDLVLDELGPLTCLVGRNGAGKTGILKAVQWAARSLGAASLRGAPFAGWLQVPFDGSAALHMWVGGAEYRLFGRWTSDIGGSGRHPTLITHCEERLSRRAADGAWQELFERRDDSLRMTERDTIYPLVPEMAALAMLRSLLPSDDPLVSLARSLREQLKSIRYYPGPGLRDHDLPTTHAEMEEHSRFFLESSYHAWIGEYTQSGEPGASVPLRLFHMSREAPEDFAQLSDILGNEGLGLISKIYVDEFPDPHPRGVKHYQLVFDTRSGVYPFHQLPGGTCRILYFLTALFFDRSGLMLIEQPEDGIHPALLYKFFHVLRTQVDPTQILLTSHSPALLSNVEPREVRLVATDSQGRTLVRGLAPGEQELARHYMEQEGSLADYLEILQQEDAT